MKALSPYLPDVPTLASLFAGAGIVATPESSERERAPARPAPGGARAPASARAAAPAPAPAAATGSASQIRFPVSTVTATATIPSKGPLRAAIPPIEPANGSGVHAIAPAHIPPRVATTTPPPVAAPKPPIEDFNDESALHHIFGNRDRSAPPLQQRFDAFVDWLGTSVGSQGSFIADADGLVLASRAAPDAYAVATVSLCHAEQSVLDYMPRPPEGTTTLELDDTRFLQVIRVETVVGRLIVGIIVAAPLSRSACTMVRRLMKIGVEWEAVR